MTLHTRCVVTNPARQWSAPLAGRALATRVQIGSSVDMAPPRLPELIALSLLAGLGCGVALAHGDLIFVAVFACAIAMTTNEAMRRLR